MGYYLAIERDTFDSVLIRRKKLLYKRSKSEREKYHLLMHIYIYIKSRKTVLMHLFAGQQWRHGTALRIQWGKERVGRTEKVALKHVRYRRGRR